MSSPTTKRLLGVCAAGALVSMTLLAVPSTASPAAAAPRASADAGAVPGRYVVVVRNAADYDALRAKATRSGAKVVKDLRALKTFVVTGSGAARTALSTDGRTAGVATDQIRTIQAADRRTPDLAAPGLRGARLVTAKGAAGPALATASATATAPSFDPAFTYKRLQWDFRRIGVPAGARITQGAPAVTVGVADTGLDFTHTDLRSRVTQVVDLTQTENPPICKTYFGTSAEELHNKYGGPATTDWNGHGSWIGGNIAGALNGTGINGIAPKVGLVSLKISQWCGSAYDSTILDAITVAANHHINVVNISFGGFTDRSDPDQNAIYRDYIDAVAYAKRHGTVIVSSAGNDHVRVGAGGKILSHGALTTPGTTTKDFVDPYGLYQTPGGVPGVVDVASTGNVVVPSSNSCPAGSTGSVSGTTPDYNATCKPAKDRHQAAGAGQQNQLSYFSNYGPRIDIAAPGGARKFNLPNYDRGGTPGFPYTNTDLTNVYEDFSTTSNWAVEIPCFTFSRGSGFPPNQCYTSIQGTSMSAPHVAAAMALSASAHPGLRTNAAGLISRVLSEARGANNNTRALSATDKSRGDLTGVPCPTGYCHLNGPRISNGDAYGNGLLNVSHP